MVRVLTVYLLAALASAATPAFERAQTFYQRTDYEAALKILLALPQKDAPACGLIGRSYFMQGDYKKASEFLERAAAAEPGSSEHHHWLGKAYGRRAETSSFITAPGLASRARQQFEQAVELNPRNSEAVNDLFEYYLEAPGILGGGLSKATALVERIGRLDPVEGHYAAAKLAEKRKEFAKAEQHLRQAVQLAPQQIGRVLDLAKFLTSQRRHEEADAVFRQAEKIAPNAPKLMFARAAAYIQAGRNIDEARRLLREYLKAPLTPDDPPRSEAEQLLRQAS